MKGGIVFKLALLTLLATVFYTYVGQLVPQKEVHPPEVTVIAADVSTEDLVAIGRDLFDGKGLCATCHTIGRSGALRFPDLANVATRAADRVAGMSALEYLAQSLYDPDAFVVPGFAAGMPPAHRPPVNLNDEEIRAVLAFLQTLGSEATITMATAIPYATATPAAADARELAEGAAAAEALPAPGAPEPAAAPDPTTRTRSATVLVESYQCASCHEARGPRLADIGQRRSREEILAALAAHDRLAGGEELTALGYYDEVTLAEARALADLVAAGGSR